jgi:AcrR family transcriptional regulator
MVQTTDLNNDAAERDGGAEPGDDRGGARERLIVAAARLFADQGFDAVSTRALAQAAEVNLSAITYHFGGKENLYQAVIQRFVDDLEPHRQRMITLLGEGVAAAEDDRRALARLAGAFVAGLIGFLLSGELPRWRIQLMLREITQPSAAFEIVMREHIGPLQDAVGGLVAAATGADPQSETTKLLTQSVVGQCLLFGLGKSVVLWRLGWDDYTPERIEQVVGSVTPAVLAALDLPQVDEAEAAP